jgi:ABC-type transporter lipoprotein component MlaA
MHEEKFIVEHPKDLRIVELPPSQDVQFMADMLQAISSVKKEGVSFYYLGIIASVVVDAWDRYVNTGEITEQLFDEKKINRYKYLSKRNLKSKKKSEEPEQQSIADQLTKGDLNENN